MSKLNTAELYYRFSCAEPDTSRQTFGVDKLGDFEVWWQRDPDCESDSRITSRRLR